MSFLLFLRDRVVPYFFLLCIVIGGVWGIGWLFAQTYFWNTSDVIFIVDNDITAVQIHIAARIIYKDFSFFQETYPFHIVLPYNKELLCSEKCSFSDIPAGESEVLFFNENGLERSERMFILPDTQGSIDMRQAIRIKDVTISQTLEKTDSLINAGINQASVIYRNDIQDLLLFYDKGFLFIYDGWLQQNILLPTHLKIRSVVRWMQDGVYYLTNEVNEVLIFDRYGRQKTEVVTHSAFWNDDIVWGIWDEGVISKLMISGQERKFPERIFWFIINQKSYLFDGNNVFEIINS